LTLILWERFERLAAATSPEVATDLLRRGLESAAMSCRRMHEAEGHADEVINEAHRLRGSAGMIGLMRISQCAEAIEREAQIGGSISGPLAELAAAIRDTIRDYDGRLGQCP
jgi:HPt (histidine-containing phosphotransfer) domain-containing protein